MNEGKRMACAHQCVLSRHNKAIRPAIYLDGAVRVQTEPESGRLHNAHTFIKFQLGKLYNQDCISCSQGDQHYQGYLCKYIVFKGLAKESDHQKKQHGSKDSKCVPRKMLKRN